MAEQTTLGLAEEFGEMDPRTLDSQSRLANILVQSGEHDKALEMLEVIIRDMDPRLPAARAAFQQHRELIEMQEPEEPDKHD